MRFFFAILLICSLAVEAQTIKRVNDLASYSSGLLAWWQMGEGAGTTITDRSGNGRTGTFHGNTAWGAGKTGNAVAFDGSDGCYTTHGNVLGFSGTNSQTISLWINPTSTSAGTIIGRYFNYRLLFSSTQLQYIQYQGSLWQDTNIWYTSASYVGAGTWKHVAMTYDGSGSSGVKMYVNGVSMPVMNSSYHSGWADDGNDFKIGARDMHYDCFTGSIQDVRIYNRALSAAEIATLSAAVPDGAIDGLVGWWPMEEKTGTEAADRAGINIGTLYGSPTWISGKIGGGLTFGSGKYVDVGSSATLNPTDITVLVWIKPSGTTGQQVITGMCNATADMYNIVDLNGTNLRMIWQAGVGNSRYWKATAVMSASIWQHVCVTRIGAETPKIYVNGIAKTVTTDGSSGYSTLPTNQATSIGRAGAYNGAYFGGDIADLRLYKRALSAAEINAMYYGKKAQYQ